MGTPYPVEVTLGDEPDVWERLGFNVVNRTMDFGEVRVKLAGRSNGSGMLSWGLAGLAEARELDGIPSYPAHDGKGAVQHPNGVCGLDTIVVHSPDWERTAAAFATVGLVAKRKTQAVRKVTQLFYKPKGCLIELVGPLKTPATPPTKPARLWGLSFVHPDLQALHTAYPDFIRAPWKAVQPGRTITTLKHPSISAAVAIMSPHVRDGLKPDERDAVFAPRAREQEAHLGTTFGSKM
eukprot:Sspe_Gene.110213::Locus_90612_Transcript_2_3_Confidence_0.333_Length_803::g.110213::m.110213